MSIHKENQLNVTLLYCYTVMHILKLDIYINKLKPSEALQDLDRYTSK